MFNGLIYNPAVAGSRDLIDLVAISRNQWVGFEGAPITQSFTASAPLGKLRSGVGAYVINDKLGFESQISSGIDYAYQLPLQTAFISLGLGVGFLQKSIDGSKVNAINQADANLPQGKSAAFVVPDLSLGVMYVRKNAYAGISFSHLTASSSKYAATSGEGNIPFSRHIYGTAGYEYPLTAHLDIRPTVFIKTTQNNLTNATFDLSSLLFYNKKVWFGLGYRSIDAAEVFAGFATGALRLGYCYDINTSRLAKFNGGSHEVVLMYQFSGSKRNRNQIIIKTPRFL